MAVSSITLLLGVLNGPYKRLKRCIRSKKIGRIIYGIVDGLIVAVVLLAITESCLMITATLNTPTEESTLIVLGSQVRADGPSVMTCYRLDAAIDYLNEYPNAKCVLSGGKGANEPWSEAKGMADYLILKGISGNRLYLEDESTSTRENLKYSIGLIEKENLNRNITIVTNDFHVYRAGRIAKRLDLDFCVCPAKSLYWIFPSYYIRELYAILADWIIYS